MSADAAAAAPQDQAAPPPPAQAQRPRLTLKQRDRIRDIEKALGDAEGAAGKALGEADAWQRAERRRVDGEMSSRIMVASREQSSAVAAAKGARSARMNEIEREHRRALSAADSARAKARNDADAAQQAILDAEQARFNEASAPVEAWYAGEKERIAAEAKDRAAAAAAAFEAVAGPLAAERDAIVEGRNRAHEPAAAPPSAASGDGKAAEGA